MLRIWCSDSRETYYAEEGVVGGNGGRKTICQREREGGCSDAWLSCAPLTMDMRFVSFVLLPSGAVLGGRLEEQ